MLMQNVKETYFAGVDSKTFDNMMKKVPLIMYGIDILLNYVFDLNVIKSL